MGHHIDQIISSGQEAAGGYNYVLVKVDTAADFAALTAFQDGSVGYIKGDQESLYVKVAGTWSKLNKSLADNDRLLIDGISPYDVLAANVLFPRRAEVAHLLESDLRQYHYMLELPTAQGTDIPGMIVYRIPDKTLHVCRVGGVQDISVLTVTKGAETKLGNITITLNGVAKTVAVKNEDTPSLVADAIAATAFPGWIVGRGAGATVNFAKEVTGAVSAPTFSDTGVTGCEAAFERTQEGVTAVWGEVDLEADTFTYLIRAALPTLEAGNFEGMIIYNTTDHTLQVCTTPGEQELDTLTVTGPAATKLGNITIKLNTEDTVVAVLKDDTAAQIAAKIKAAVDAAVAAETIAAWTVTCVGAVLTFKKDVIGACSAPTAVDTDETGATFSAFTRTNQGEASVWADLINVG